MIAVSFFPMPNVIIRPIWILCFIPIAGINKARILFDVASTRVAAANVTVVYDYIGLRLDTRIVIPNDAVIYIKEAEQPSVTTKENCLIIQGYKEDLVRAADKVLWIWYGIIK